MRLQNFQNYIFAHEQRWPSGSTEKRLQSTFLCTAKTMLCLLFYLTKNSNLISQMETLFLLVLPHRKWKACFSLVCATENGNPVSPYFASQKMETLFLLVLRHSKWKPCLSLFCATENGNPVSPCFASQKMETLFLLILPHRKWKPCFSLFCVTVNGNPVYPCFAPQKNGNPVFPILGFQKNSKSLFSWRFRLTSRLPRSILFFFSKKKVKENPACP